MKKNPNKAAHATPLKASDWFRLHRGAHGLDVLQKMKIHHTIHVPRDYDRLDDLKRYLVEKFSSELHEFEFIEAEVERPMPHQTYLKIEWDIDVSNSDGIGRERLAGLTSSFDLRGVLLRYHLHPLA